MSIRVLIVDGSTKQCQVIKQILEKERDFLVVGFAHTGQEAIFKVANLEPDVVTLNDVLPTTDIVAVVKRIMAKTPVPILLFSETTQLGVNNAFDALMAGAIDFLPKHLGVIHNNLRYAEQCLRQRVRDVAAAGAWLVKKKLRNAPPKQVSSIIRVPSGRTFAYVNSNYITPHPVRVLVIIAATGGLVAIQAILARLPKTCSMSVLIIQHLHASLTPGIAVRLDSLCAIRVKGAEHGDTLQPGLVLLAPGDSQVNIGTQGDCYRVELEAKTVNEYGVSSVDSALSSVAHYFGKRSLSVILTGACMGGKAGAVKLKQAGAKIWVQNAANFAFYGMPKTVIDANLADKVLELDDIAHAFSKFG